ncbi:MAG: hypothetical protein ACREVE_09275 [Gammaproteobacteria bacterium]
MSTAKDAATQQSDRFDGHKKPASPTAKAGIVILSLAAFIKRPQSEIKSALLTNVRSAQVNCQMRADRNRRAIQNLNALFRIAE